MADLADKRKAALDELTREEIRKAANRVIAAHGMSSMTMATVAEEAGLAKGTLYNYFEDKSALIFYVIIKAFEPLCDQMEDVADADIPPVDQLTRAAQTMLGSITGHQELLSMAVQARPVVDPAKALPEMLKLRTRVERALTRIVKRGIDQGAFREGDPARVARTFFASLNGLIHPRVFHKSAQSADEEIADLMDIFLHGIVGR